MTQSSPEMKRKLELAAYAVIGITALGISIWLARPAPTNTAIPSRKPIEAGVELGMPSEWSSQGNTLVLALQRGCHFCAESAPFYKRLGALAGNSKKLHFTAVLPQPVTQSKQYLASLGLEFGDVRQASLGTLRIPGTPTLLLVDSQGVVKNVWVGRLTAAGETQVLNTLGLVQH
jgi:hypothetical protein